MLHPGFAQARSGKQAAEAAADHQHVHVLVQRGALHLHAVRVVQQVGEALLDVQVSTLAGVGGGATVTLLAVARPQSHHVERRGRRDRLSHVGRAQNLARRVAPKVRGLPRKASTRPVASVGAFWPGALKVDCT